MGGEWAESEVGCAIVFGRNLQMPLKPPHGSSDRVRHVLCAVFAAHGVMALKFNEWFEFAEGLGPDRVSCVIGIEDSFELAFSFIDGTHGLEIVESQAALLEPGAAGKLQ